MLLVACVFANNTNKIHMLEKFMNKIFLLLLWVLISKLMVDDIHLGPVVIFPSLVQDALGS